MKVTAQGSLATVKAVGVGGLVLLGVYVVHKLWNWTGSAVTAVEEGFAGTSDALASVAYDTFEGDANVAAQQTFRGLKADLDANGNPPVGSALYNQIMLNNGRPDLVVNNGNGG